MSQLATTGARLLALDKEREIAWRQRSIKLPFDRRMPENGARFEGRRGRLFFRVESYPSDSGGVAVAFIGLDAEFSIAFRDTGRASTREAAEQEAISNVESVTITAAQTLLGMSAELLRWPE